jgi:hypothetical protein
MVMRAIRDRVQDARVLWAAGRREGAFLCVLVAVAARARLSYPLTSGVSDREAFERFLTCRLPWRLEVEFREQLHAIEHIFYKWFRCELVHEGGFPVDLEFLDDEGGLVLRAGGAPTFKLGVSPEWFDKLADCALTALEEDPPESSAAQG